MYLTVARQGQSAIPATLTGSKAREPGLMIMLRYSTSVMVKEHFSSLR